MRATGRGVNSQPRATLDKLFTQVVYAHVPLSPISIIRYQPTGGDARRLAECNDSLPPGLWLQYLRADCRGRDQLRNLSLLRV